MNKKISLGAAIAFMAIVATAVFTITWIQARREFNVTVDSLKERETRYSKIAEIDNRVRENYIGTIAEKELTDKMAEGFMNGIGDSYAQYIDATSYKLMMADFSGKTVQIGIVTKMDESGYIKVTEVYPDSPAQAVGIEPDDLIVKIDDLDVTKDNYYEAVNMLKGEAGTKMTIILRKGVEDSTLEMTRRFVEVPSVASQMLDGNIGLITFKLFNDNTPDQFSKQVDKLIDEGATALIFDVRGVNTGTQRSVAQVLDKLLPKGDIILSTNKDGVDTVLATSDAREITLPMAVLVNEKTSGEAELFAQALKDFNKGKLVGTKTAGKGTVQKIFPLTDGSAIRMTTAKYRTPFSPSYDGEGVKPDYDVKLADDQVNTVGSGSAENDQQLKKAVEVVVADVKIADNAAGNGTAASSSEALSSSSQVSSSEEEASSGEEDESSAEESDDSSDAESEAGESSSSEEASSDAESSAAA